MPDLVKNSSSGWELFQKRHSKEGRIAVTCGELAEAL
jgi:hypothetical protein